MVEISKNRKVTVILVVSIVLILLAIAILDISFNDHDCKGGVQYTDKTSYSIDIMSLDNESYFLMVPVPVDEDGHPIELVADMNVREGDADFEVVHESYGWVMKIHGKGNVRIAGEIPSFLEPVFPSLVNSTGPPLQNPKHTWEEKIPVYWNSTVYSDRNLSLSIVYSSQRINGCYDAEGITWGTITWDYSNDDWEPYTQIEGSGWVPLSLNVQSVLG